MPALRLKAKLVIAITLMVVAIVAVLQTLYLSQIVHQRIRETYTETQNVAAHIFALARNALDVDLSGTKINLNDPAQVTAAERELLQTDTSVASLLESVSANEPAIVDAIITDSSGAVVVSSGQSGVGKPAPDREGFSSVVTGGIRKQLEVIYGPPRFYNVSIPFTRRDGSRFGEVRVGVSTTLLKYELQDRMRRALIYSGLAILICLLISAVLSNLALRPLRAISRRLD
ncbi:MAG: hypothetical protein ACRD4F_04515, partial [Candidatus Angelobacter sp.]